MKIIVSILGFAGRMALGLPLLWAGWEKLQAFDWWLEKFAQMELVPAATVGVVAAAFPGVELVIGLTLVLGFWTRAALWMTSFLYGIFAVVLAWLMYSGTAEACGCFGPDSDLVVDGPALGLRIIAAVAALSLQALPLSILGLDQK